MTVHVLAAKITEVESSIVGLLMIIKLFVDVENVSNAPFDLQHLRD